VIISIFKDSELQTLRFIALVNLTTE